MRPERLLVGSAQDNTAVRRNNHGGFAWTASDTAENLHQPQDGAQEKAASYASISKKSMLREAEDARLTGGTRSLMRRVMGLNVTALTAVRKVGPQSVPAKTAQVA